MVLRFVLVGVGSTSCHAAEVSLETSAAATISLPEYIGDDVNCYFKMSASLDKCLPNAEAPSYAKMEKVAKALGSSLRHVKGVGLVMVMANSDQLPVRFSVHPSFEGRFSSVVFGNLADQPQTGQVGLFVQMDVSEYWCRQARSTTALSMITNNPHVTFFYGLYNGLCRSLRETDEFSSSEEWFVGCEAVPLLK